ncbi:MAG: hypothetical protein U1F63_12880 [Chitinivorax sp.]
MRIPVAAELLSACCPPSGFARRAADSGIVRQALSGFAVRRQVSFVICMYFTYFLLCMCYLFSQMAFVLRPWQLRRIWLALAGMHAAWLSVYVLNIAAINHQAINMPVD